ncbi:hypothetical protein GCM10022255_010760 [Dactylosporangium darangshiense]|uniref:Uncharacterized protein n=1 Tax=Dactylosporangium darangshiense TaxID=579108 RepID=A0ABP8CYT2_9ACTN
MPARGGIGVLEGEVERGMCRLTGLGARREIGAGHEIEARDPKLTVRHEAIVITPVKTPPRCMRAQRSKGLHVQAA